MAINTQILPLNREVYKLILSMYYTRPAVLLAVCTELVRVILNRIVNAVLLSQVIAFVSQNEISKARDYILYFALCSIIAIFIGLIGDIVGVKSENKAYEQVGNRFYQKLLNKDMSFYRDSHTGSLTALFRQFLDSTMDISRFLRGPFIASAVTLVAPVVVLYSRNKSVGLAIVAMVVVQFIYISWYSKKTKQTRNESMEVYRQINGIVSDDLTNIIAFKSSGLAGKSFTKFSKYINKESVAFTKRRLTNSILDLPRSVGGLVFICLTFWLALDDGKVSTATIAVLSLVFTYIFQIIRTVNEIPEMVQLQDVMVTRVAQAMHVLSGENENVKDLSNARHLKIEKGKITFKDVTFAYDGQKTTSKVLDNFCLCILPGEKVGIVGLSGAGKSTIANLLMRFNDLDSGSICIDGHDISHVNQNSLRRQIAYVSQEPLLFHRTIKENLVYEMPNSTDESIARAAKIAHADEFIIKLADGYNTMVGERGVKLSGGQKQRLIIARAILKDAPIVLFDEATSALDSESEQLIQQALPDIMKNKTAVVIAHRLSTLATMDRVVVLHDGVIVEQGSHKKLLALNGRYAGLWAKQTRS